MSSADDKMVEEVSKAASGADVQVTLSLLKATLESTADGILVVDSEGKVIGFNERFRKMWKIPTAVMKRGNDAEAVACVLKQLKRPDDFVNGLEKLYSDPGSDCFDELEFLDGRIFERYSIPQRIGKKIVGRVFSFRDVSKRKEMENQLIYQATYDTLTTLPNRVLLMDRIGQAIKHAKRNGTKVAVVFFDLDRFKLVNDSLGHTMGDILLQSVARRLKNCIREEDTLARWGGDEFIMVLTALKNENHVVPIIKKCMGTLDDVFSIDRHNMSITCSAGISFFPNDGDDATVLLKNADSAMYHAKSEGRNNFQFYTSEMNERAIDQLELENDLHKALQKNEFVLHYQPLVNLKTGHIVCVEALLRWIHPSRGLVSPLNFIPVAEETGLIVPIGEWVLRTACQQNKDWQNAGFSPIKMAVNVAGLQFRQQNLISTVSDILKSIKLSPEYLEIELTESTVMDNTQIFLHGMTLLKNLGVGLVIDDFGTGYSSLSYLKRFPINKLKIDRSFIEDVTTNEDSEAIVQAIIAMAQKLKLRVVAEGVETKEQLALLIANNCDEMQGYYFSKPLPKDACTELLLKSQKNPIMLPQEFISNPLHLSFQKNHSEVERN